MAAFSSSHSLNLPYPLPLCLHHLASPSTNERVARLSPILTAYDALDTDRIWIADDDLEPEMDIDGEKRRELADCEVVSGGEAVGAQRAGEGGRGERVVERVKFRIRNEVAIPLYNHVIVVEGHRIWDTKTNTILYTSTSTTSPLITTRWTRTISTSPDDPDATVVSEEIRGTCPGYLRWITERETRKSQKLQMGGYESLFKEEGGGTGEGE